MAGKEVFRSFFLFVLSHPSLLSNRDLVKTIERRIKEAKKVILRKTKPNDLIAFERPERTSFMGWALGNPPVYQHIYGEKEGIKNLRRLWNTKGERLANFYTELAEFAEANGRRVLSLEPSATRIASKISQIYAKMEMGPIARDETPIFEEIKGIRLDAGRTKSFARRIQREKPKMAIMGSGHGVLIEYLIKPRKTKYFPKISRGLKAQRLSEQIAEQERFENLRRQRRTRINQRLREEGKLSKRKKHLKGPNRRLKPV